MSLLFVVIILAVIIIALVAWIFFAQRSQQQIVDLIESYVEQILVSTARMMSPEEISNVNWTLAGRVYPEVIIIESQDGIAGQDDPVRIGTMEQFQNAMENRIINATRIYAVRLKNDLFVAATARSTLEYIRTALQHDGKPVQNAEVVAEGYFDCVGTFYRTTQYHQT